MLLRLSLSFSTSSTYRTGTATYKLLLVLLTIKPLHELTRDPGPKSVELRSPFIIISYLSIYLASIASATGE